MYLTVSLTKKIYKDVYIPAYPDDTGVSIGAAYLANYKFNKKIKRKIYHEKHNYFGPSYSNNEILTELKKSKLSFISPKNLEKYIAIKISEGKLIGWFQGSMEFSHRALGNRSILADPRNPEMKDILNRAIKFREGFRPFAPSVLEEEASKIFELNKKDRVYFMEKTAIVRANWRKKFQL